MTQAPIRRSPARLAATLALACLMAPAHASPRPGPEAPPAWAVYTDARERLTADALAWAGADIVLTDASGRRRALPRASVLAVLRLNPDPGPIVQPSIGEVLGRDEPPADEAASPFDAAGDEDPGDAAAARPGPPAPQRTLVLTDGQSFPGGPATEGGSTQSLVWRSPALGVLTAPVDRVAAVLAQGQPLDRAASPAADTIALVNGDRLEGFLESAWPAPRLDPQGDATPPIDIPWERIDWLRLANDRAPGPALLAWLDDGTVAGLRELTPDPAAGDALTLRPELGAPVRLEAPRLHALLLDGSRLASLASLQLLAQEPTGLVDIDPAPAPLGAAPIALGGHGRATWALPAWPTPGRLALRAHLPERSRAWGSLTLVVSIEQGSGPARELARATLEGSSPQATLQADLPPSPAGAPAPRLVLEVSDHRGGPVQDRAVISEAVLWTGPAPRP